MAGVDGNTYPTINGDLTTNVLIVEIFKKIDEINKFQDTFQDQKKGIMEQLDAINKKVVDMKSKIQTLNAEISALKSVANGKSDENVEKITELTNQIQEYKNAISKINEGLALIKTENLTFEEIAGKVAELDNLLTPVVGGRKISGGYLYRRSRKRYSKKSQRPSTYSSKKFKGGGYPYRKKRNKSKKQSYRRKTKQSKKRHYK